MGVTRIIGYIPKGALSTRRDTRPIRLLDIVTLLGNAYIGAEREDVGFEDARETLISFTKRLDRRTDIPLRIIESALWSCNLLNEKGEFWDPRGRTFEQFLRDLLGSEKFNLKYNLVEKEGGIE